MIFKPWPYQKFSIRHILKYNFTGLFLEMGLGKTVSVLTALLRMFKSGEITKVLVIAPLRVADHTWSSECQKWDHLKHLKISKCLGNQKQRIAGLKAKADIYVINRENVAWMAAYYGGAFPFDLLVIDELSSFKNKTSNRFIALAGLRPRIKSIIGLTGTPAPNSLLDLWPQLFLLDQGERLGTFGDYKRTYFNEGDKGGPSGHIVLNYKLKKEKDKLIGRDYYEKLIFDKIGDICISMKARDYLDLPERIDVVTEVELSRKVKRQYDEFERDSVLELLDDMEEAGQTNISAANAAALSNKLLQFANGAVYDADKNWHVFHDEKLDVLEERIEAANGNNTLIFYSFQHDYQRMMKRFKGYRPQKLETNADIDRWNAGKIEMAIAHPLSMGHGLNLQDGGRHMFWFGVPWGLEAYLQAVARLDRQGQQFRVLNDKLLCPGTIDFKVLKSLEFKASGQNRLMSGTKAMITGVNEIIEKYR